ncbi:MAG: hypothetical protein LUF82_03745 [Clostridia bacterium]|nr:hypothetical protein [Clostridia bacterium]
MYDKIFFTNNFLYYIANICKKKALKKFEAKNLCEYLAENDGCCVIIIKNLKDKTMNKYTDNTLVEQMDDIILLNDNYAAQGLYKGYLGVTIENLIEKLGYILADFYNPISGKDIAVLAKIKKDDFRVLSNSLEDKVAAKAFKDLCNNKNINN